MQAFVSRLYLTPVRDEDAESQRKAKSRHARQTRRSTQGVTLGELREALKTNGLSSQEDRACPRNSLTEFTEEREIHSKEQEGNTGTESTNRPRRSLPGNGGVSYSITAITVVGRWRDENQNRVEDPSQLTISTIHKERYGCTEGEGLKFRAEHERLSRYDSSGESVTDRPLGRTSSYTRREGRLSSLSKQDTDSTAKDYKKMYAEALHENERLKSRLQDSKQELVRIRSQLEKVTQRQDRISERSTALESEKRDKQGLEKRVSDMEEEIKVLTELKTDNQRLKDENGALIRVISKLSK